MLAGYRVTSQKVSRIMNIKFKKSDGTVVPGQVTLQDEADENEDLVAVKIKLAEKTYEARAESYFETLQNLRKELERDGIQILCNGAARNVYPSPMTLAMGYGRKAYKMTWESRLLGRIWWIFLTMMSRWCAAVWRSRISIIWIGFRV